MKVKFSLVQMKISSNIDKNLIKAEKYIRKAKNKGSHIIVFPEGFLTGLVYYKDVADSEKKYIKIFQELAEKYSIDIVTGSIIEREGRRLFNNTYYVNKKGKILAKYRKVNLWSSERDYLKHGKKVKVFNTEYGRVGLIICWDLMFPEMFREMAKRDADIVICPAYWTKENHHLFTKNDLNSDVKLINSLCTARAFENNVVLVFCNAAGKLVYDNIKERLAGHSQITVPFKGSLVKMKRNKEVMINHEVETHILKDAERAYKIRHDLKHRAPMTLS